MWQAPHQALVSCALVAAVTLQSTAEPAQGGPNPLLCLGHFSGSFSSHGSVALNSSAQIQGTLIASNSKSQAAATGDRVGHRESPDKRKRQPLSHVPWEPDGFLAFSSPQEKWGGGEAMEQGQEVKR